MSRASTPRQAPERERPQSNGRLVAAIAEVLEPVANSAGLDLEEVEVVPAGRRRVLRVVVDRDGGIDLDGVADTSRAFATALDDGDVMGAAPYVLEVTSPGVDRPLTEPRHWRRATGRLVHAPLIAGAEVRGRIVSADEATVTIAGDAGEQIFGYADLGAGHIEVEFNRREDDPTGRTGGGGRQT